MSPLYDIQARDFAERCYEIYHTLREREPMHHDARDFFLASRYEDVRAISNDAQRFSNEGVSTAVGALPIVQQIDPPLHNDLRALVTTAFTPRRVSEIAPRIRGMARELIAGFAARGRCDFLAEFARHLPSMVICEMLGVPPERRELLLETTETLLGISQNGENSVESAALKVGEEFKGLLEQRRRERRADLMSALIDAEIDGGRRLSEQELLGFCFQLVLAGTDTTMNLIANGAVLLARHPDQRREILRDASLLPNAIEEMLRIESPTQVLPRRATCDLELHGVAIPAGSEVRLLYGSANRDDRMFAEPERFDIHRENAARHLAFGQGLHFCVGAALARLEARIALEEFLAVCPEYELAEQPRWLRSAWARSYQAVPLRFEPVSRASAPASRSRAGTSATPRP